MVSLSLKVFALSVSLLLPLGPDGLATKAAAESASLSALFQKGKREFKLAAYGQSLETFNALDTASREPGQEEQRARLAPVISFYRAANFAALGRREDARMKFEEFLSSFPRTDLDESAFPKVVLEAFREAREKVAVGSAQRHSARDAAQNGGIRATYASFRPSAGYSPVADERWVNGPIRYLMTKSEKLEWDRIQDSMERTEFVVKFWQARDPDPLTPENEFREEFEKRIRFSDAYFTIDEKRGSETDRGLVFALLGPPTYIAQFSLTSQDDPIQVVRAEPVRRMLPANPQNPASGTSPVLEEQTPLTAQQIQGVREIWHYGRAELSRFIPFKEIDFEFLTKPGYGIGVLQRDQTILLALETAARASQSQRQDGAGLR